MEKKTKTDKIAESITLLAEAIKGLEVKLDAAISSVVTKQISPDPVVSATLQVEAQESHKNVEDYMPQEFREIIDERLNPKFKAKVTYRHDDGSPMIGVFGLHIWVPKEYSNASENHWATHKQDLRFRAIEIALGEIGVREWVDKIATNLGHDIMFRVKQELVTV